MADTNQIEKSYQIAKETYAVLGVDTEMYWFSVNWTNPFHS